MHLVWLFLLPPQAALKRSRGYVIAKDDLNVRGQRRCEEPDFKTRLGICDRHKLLLSAEARAQKLRRQRQGPKIQKIEHNFFLCSLISGEAKHGLTLPSVRAARATGEEAKAARSLVETLGDKHTPDAQFLLAGMKSYYQSEPDLP